MKYGINVGGNGPIAVERVDMDGFWDRNRFDAIVDAEKFVKETDFDMEDWVIFNPENGHIIQRMA